MHRKKIIIGNWKMYKNMEETKTFLNEFSKLIKSQIITCEYGIASSVTNLALLQAQQLPNLIITAQNCHYEYEGAYTGEISIPMLQDLAVSHVIVGHSERRMYFNETNDTINKKIQALFKNKMIPILCCGESLEQYESQSTNDIIETQIKLALANVSALDVINLIIAYEPIWAIGTGKTATAMQAQSVCTMIRKVVSELYDGNTAQMVRIQYGGSVKPENIKSLLAQSNIDGVLVGGASLVPQSFLDLLI